MQRTTYGHLARVFPASRSSGYLVLSLRAKSMLAWQVFGNMLAG